MTHLKAVQNPVFLAISHESEMIGVIDALHDAFMTGPVLSVADQIGWSMQGYTEALYNAKQVCKDNTCSTAGALACQAAAVVGIDVLCEAGETPVMTYGEFDFWVCVLNEFARRVLPDAIFQATEIERIVYDLDDSNRYADMSVVEPGVFVKYLELRSRALHTLLSFEGTIELIRKHGNFVNHAWKIGVTHNLALNFDVNTEMSVVSPSSFEEPEEEVYAIEFTYNHADGSLMGASAETLFRVESYNE